MPQDNLKLPPGATLVQPSGNNDDFKLPPGATLVSSAPSDVDTLNSGDVDTLNSGGVITPKEGESFAETMMRAAKAGQHVSQDAVDYNTEKAESTAPFVVGGLGAAAAAPELAAFLAAHPQIAKTVAHGLGYGASFGAGMSIWHVLAHIFSKGGGGGTPPPSVP